MPSIETLVKDIEQVVQQGCPSPESLQNYALNLGKSYARQLSREPRVRTERTLYFSEVGDPCDRRTWYRLNMPELIEDVPPSSRIKFMYGDMLEELVLQLARDAGHEVACEQMSVTHPLYGGWQVKGRIDAVIDGVVVDVKSVTKNSEKKFWDGLRDDPFGYMQQLNGYASAMGKESAGFLTIQKELGHINYFQITTDSTTFWNIAKHKLQVVTGPIPRDRLKGVPQSATSKNTKLCPSCSYCAYKTACWGKDLRVFAYATGPEFLINVVDTPRVREITHEYK